MDSSEAWWVDHPDLAAVQKKTETAADTPVSPAPPAASARRAARPAGHGKGIVVGLGVGLALLFVLSGLLVLAVTSGSSEAVSSKAVEASPPALLPSPPEPRGDEAIASLPADAPALPPPAARTEQAPERPGRAKVSVTRPSLAVRTAPAPAEQAGLLKDHLLPPAKVQPVARVNPARPGQTAELELLAQLAEMPQVGIEDCGQNIANTWGSFLKDHGSVGNPAPVLMVKPSLAALFLRSGEASRVSSQAARELAVLSQKLHAYIDALAPLKPDGTRATPKALEKKLKEEKHRKRPEWLRVEAVPTLQQILMHEGKPLRRLLVDLLSQIPEARATAALSRRALFDLDPEIRAAARNALKTRNPEDYRPVLERALRYPWAPAAWHAAEALLELKTSQAVPSLITLLDQPEPSAVQTRGKRFVVQDLVKIRHTTNCLLCHAPSGQGKDLCMAADPILTRTATLRTKQALAMAASGQLNPNNLGRTTSYYTGATTVTGLGKEFTQAQVPVQVRFDINFLRQDFSVQLPGAGIGAIARFDYVIRTQVISPQKAAQLRARVQPQDSYSQRDAVLFALRGLTGQDAGSTSIAWQQLYPTAPTDAEADRLLGKLLQAGPLQRPLLVKNYRAGKGEAFTEALLGAVVQVSGPSRDEVRAALAHRLAELGQSPLRGYLHAGKAPVRQAAVLACERKKDMALVPDLIARLGDADASTGRLAGSALKSLTGQELSTQQQWQQWWAQGSRLVRN
jgi:HEAT repeat protein